jgi:hypothetical protein
MVVVRSLRRLAPDATPAAGRAGAELMLSSLRQIDDRYAAGAMREVLDRLLDSALRSGWGPADLSEAVTRKHGRGHDRDLAGLLLRARRRDVVEVSASWDEELAHLGQSTDIGLGDLDGWGWALRLAALLAALPSGGEVPTGGAQRQTPVAGRNGAKLAQVRALLAKAASTEFPEEAEALSAKAQEMIARYSLERLLQDAHGESTDQSRATFRRLWLDAPYVSAKSTLVHQVAEANRSRAIFDPTLGLCTIVGAPFDLDAVELMVTSLLVQVERAMLAHGRVADGYGRSRTRSFRQSFMVSFATHIGERLRAATAETQDDVDDQVSLLPAIVSHDEQVEALTDQMFPNLVSRQTRISNAAGWAGGRAAAELAILDGHRRLA